MPNCDVNANGFPDERTPLHLATSNGHADVVELLLSAPNIDVNAVDAKGQTALHIVANMAMGTSGDMFTVVSALAMLRILLEVRDIDVNAKNNGGSTPLHEVARGGDIGMAEVLLEFPTDVNAEDRKGRTPLHFAAMYGRRDVVRVLLEVTNVEVNIEDNEGRTTFDLAQMYGYTAVMQMLVNVTQTTKQ